MNRDFRYRLDKAGNFIKFKNGKPIKPGGTGIYPVYGSNGIIGMSDEYREENSVIIGRVGAYCGSVQFCRGRYWASDNTIVASPKDNDTDVVFLYYVLKNANLNRWSGGAAQPLMTQTVIKEIELPHPDISIQRKIASILSAYDDLIENNTRRIQILEEMAQLIYREWFVNFRFPGYEKVRFVNSELGKIPEGWEVRKVGNILEKVKRKKKVKKQNYESDGSIPVVDQGRNFIGGYTTDIETLHSTPLPIIVFGDHTRILKYVDFPFACGADGTQLLKPNTERMPIALFYYALKFIDLSDFAYSRHFKFLKEKEIIIPDEQTARLFEEMVKPLREQIKCLRDCNNNLRRTRDLLLPKLISGEIDVSNLDIDIRDQEQ